MTRLVGLVLFAQSTCLFPEDEIVFCGTTDIKTILGLTLAHERREFLRANHVGDETLNRVSDWLRIQAGSDVAVLSKVIEIVLSGESFSCDGDTYEITAEDKREIEMRLKLLDKWRIKARMRSFLSRLGCFRSSSSAESSLSTLVDAVMPYIPIRFRDEESISVEKILSLESIQQALSDSISTDLRFHGSDAPPSYDSLVGAETELPPRYETIFRDQFIESEAQLIFDVVRFCRSNRKADLTNQLVHLMYTNWLLDGCVPLPCEFKIGAAASVAQTARKLGRNLNNC